MPFEHTHWILNKKEIDDVLSYNKNDVLATYKFLLVTLGLTSYLQYKGKDKIALRTSLSQNLG